MLPLRQACSIGCNVAKRSADTSAALREAKAAAAAAAAAAGGGGAGAKKAAAVGTFDDLIEDECPMCLEMPDNPVKTKCGHVFCRECILQVIHKTTGNQKALCPSCRTKITNESELLTHVPLKTDDANKRKRDDDDDDEDEEDESSDDDSSDDETDDEAEAVTRRSFEEKAKVAKYREASLREKKRLRLEAAAEGGGVKKGADLVGERVRERLESDETKAGVLDLT